MAKPPAYVTVRGVRYVPETPEVATRRRAEKQERLVLKAISKTVAAELSRSGPSKLNAERDQTLYHHAMYLRGGLNSFEFEGSLVLPPKRIETRDGKGEMAVFIVGFVTGNKRKKGEGKTMIYVNAYGDLASAILARYRWKDHIRVWGKMTSLIKYGRAVVSFAAHRVELVARHPENADMDDAGAAVLERMMPSAEIAAASILDRVLGVAVPAE